MSAITTIVLADGQATPVNHSFAPVRITPEGVASFADRIGGIALGYSVLSLSLREPTKVSRAYKMQMKIVIPTLEVTSPSTATGIQPAPTKAYECLCNADFVFPERSTLAERKNLLAYVKNSLANAVIVAMVENLEAIY